MLFFSSIILVLQEKKEEFFQNANKLYIGFQIFFILLVLCIFLSCTNNISIINEKMPCNVKIIDFLRTKYQTIIIFEKGNFRFITNVIDGTFIQSVINLKNIDMLVASYLKQFYFFSKIPNQTNVLCLGSGGGIFPRIYFEKMFSINKEFKMDVVEIDPIMIDIAKKYFYFYENKNIKCYIDDARIFLNRIAIEKNKYYNIIFVDIYQENSGIPFQIITKEAFSKMKQVLSEDGIVVINVVSAIEGKKSQVYRAIYKTMQEVFPEVKAFRIEPKSTKEFQNIILVGFKSAINPSFIEDIKNNEIIQCSEIDNIKILVDDYAPLEKYTFSL